ncbi:MAG: dynamin family protein [Candidatus Eremiobacteraeota bacterium]|nr:dynamin family protein [Candidatus Eremiobacteraeota bacterium]
MKEPKKAERQAGTSIPDLRSQMEKVRETMLSLASIEGPWKQCIDDIEKLAGRLDNSVLHIAVLGQFKRGKSTLINSLLGHDILPRAMLPLTSVPTLLKYGEERIVTILFRDGSSRNAAMEDLPLFVTEEGNPGNEKNVERAEIFCDAPLLRQGVVIIDTPGIGSTLTHNTAVTVEFLPQCDLALFLTSPDPPLTQAELEFLSLISKHAAHLFFVLNKRDILSEEELRKLLSFLEKNLREKAGFRAPLEIFPVSALRGLEGRLAGNEDAWEQSGMERLESHLAAFFEHEKKQILCRALAMKTRAIIEGSLAAIDLRINLLATPLRELDEKILRLSALEAHVKEERLWIRDALEAEEKRIALEIRRKTERLEQEAMEAIFQGIRDITGTNDKKESFRTISSRLRTFLDSAVPDFFIARKDSFIADACRLSEEKLSPVLAKAENLIATVRRDALAIFEVRTSPLVFEPFSLKWPRFIWEHIVYSCGLFEVAKKLLYHAVPVSTLKKVLRREAMEEAESLVLKNAGKLRYALLDGLERVIRNLNFALASELEQGFRDIREAVQQARTLQGETSGSQEPLIGTLREKKAYLESLLAGEVSA